MKLKLLIFSLLFVNKIFGIEIFQAFENLPEEKIPMLNSALKSELLERKDSVKNIFGGVTKMLKFCKDEKFLSLQTTKSSRLEMKIFDFEGDTVIALITRVFALKMDSKLEFFTTNFEKIECENPLSANDFLILEENEILQEFKTLKFPEFIGVSFENENNLNAEFSTFETFFDEEKLRFEKILKCKKLQISVKKPGEKIALEKSCVNQN